VFSKFYRFCCRLDNCWIHEFPGCTIFACRYTMLETIWNWSYTLHFSSGSRSSNHSVHENYPPVIFIVPLIWKHWIVFETFDNLSTRLIFRSTPTDPFLTQKPHLIDQGASRLKIPRKGPMNFRTKEYQADHALVLKWARHRTFQRAKQLVPIQIHDSICS